MQVITDSEFQSVVLDSEKPVLVDFFATWCGPCRQLLPIMEEVSEEMASVVTIVKMDIDDAPKTPADFGIQTIPTLILFKDGKEIARSVGSMPKSALESFIKDNI